MTLASDSRPQGTNDSDEESAPGGPGAAFGAPGPRTDINPMETQALISVIERMIESFTHAVSNMDKGIYQGPAF